MMTQNEVIDLLSAISAYDNRNASKAAVLAWREASGRGRWTFTEALDAVHDHYAESTVFVMPGHVTERIRVARQEAAMRELVDPPPDPAGQRRVAELLAGVFPSMPNDDSSDWLSEVLARRCPSCSAEPGQSCARETPEGRVPIRFPHLPRMRPQRDAS
jgi:hypothetical protein